MMVDGALSAVMLVKQEGSSMGLGNFLLGIVKKTATDTVSSMKETQKFIHEYERYDTKTLKAEFKKTSNINRKRAIAGIVAKRRGD